jgi:hypothetical protein
MQSDWGGEYCSVNKFLNTQGIIHRLSCPHTHQQNQAIERKHRHIVETGLALLSHANLPSSFWDDTFSTACYLIYRMPTWYVAQRDDTWILNLYVLPLTIVRINCTIVRVIEPQRLWVVLRNRISKEYI